MSFLLIHLRISLALLWLKLSTMVEMFFWQTYSPPAFIYPYFIVSLSSCPLKSSQDKQQPRGIAQHTVGHKLSEVIHLFIDS